MLNLEFIAQDADAVRVTAQVGAARVELCQALALGGLTPSIGTVHAAVEAAAGNVEVFALIRPRAGGFVYDADEIYAMERDVSAIVAAGASGVVIGAVTADGELDLETLRRLRDAAGGAPVALHRAIDAPRDPLAALDAAIDLGAIRVLTSGGAPTAAEGIERLRALVEHAQGRIQIMAGSGVKSGNVASVFDAGVDAIHASAKRTVRDASMPMGSADGGWERIDADEAALLAQALRTLGM